MTTLLPVNGPKAMSSVQAPAETLATALGLKAGPAAATKGPLCPECMTHFVRKHPNQLFCSVAHRDMWNNRASVRGRVLTPLAIVARVTRFGGRGDADTGKRASRDAHMLMQRWVEEDRAAGRMSQSEYLRRRYQVGFDPLG